MIFNKEKLSVECKTAIDSLRTLFNMEKARRIKRIDQVCLIYTSRVEKQNKIV